MKLNVNQALDLEKNLIVELSLMLIQSNAKEVTNPYFYDAGIIKEVLK